MSFPLVCHACGAPSGPSVGVCPYCKASLAPKTPEEASISSIRKAFDGGDLPRALSLLSAIESQSELISKPEVAVLSAQILLEAEAPTFKIRNVLNKAHLRDPENEDVLEYIEVVEAKGNLTSTKNDLGEQKLAAVLKRSPKNAIALFLYGTHLYWVEKDVARARLQLEKCVGIRPNFLRAWGCLGAMYKNMGNIPLAKRAFEKCLSLEKDQLMLPFFKEELASLA